MAAGKKKTTMIQTNISVDEDKWEKLREIAAHLRVPAAVLARQGIDSVLEIAETQQNTIERTLAEIDSRESR